MYRNGYAHRRLTEVSSASTLALAAVVLIVLAGILWFLGPMNALGMVLAFLRWAAIPVLLPFAIILGLLEVARRSDRYASWAIGTAVVVGVTAILTTMVAITYGYKAAYAASVETVQGTPTYDERAPFVLAEEIASRDMQNIVGEREEVNFVPDHPDEAAYTSLVVGRGFAPGHSAVLSMTPALIGTTPSSTHCEFSPDADLLVGGKWPMNNLKRAIRGETSPLLRMNTRDAYGYCDGDTPIVVWPVTKMAGWYPAYDVPAGVVTYNGQTGEITHHDEVPDGLRGPSYPLSVAEAQSRSTTASNGFMDFLFRRVGFEDTTGDAADPNGDNATDMVMRDSEGRVQYVTPVTPRGASQSIVALLSIEARGTSGGLSPMVVHEIETPRVANSTIDGRLRSEYAELPWASGMKVFEVAPGPDPGTWVASIGQRQEVTLRADVAADGAISLRDRSGSVVHEDRSPDSGTPDQGERSVEEIRAEIDALLDELSRRGGEGG